MAITTTDNDIKERLSLAYLTAVAAAAGCQVTTQDHDKESVDAIVRPISGVKCQINVQLKATSDKSVFDGHDIKFALPIKNYDDLRDLNDIIPHYLVLLYLPGTKTEWLKMTINDMIINGGAYFGNLHGLPTVSNDTTKTIRFSATQVFDVKQLANMMLAAPNRIGTSSV
jgi:hypothetical protein